MARIEIPVYLINRDEFLPFDPVAGDITDGMFFAGNGGYTFLELENTGAGTFIVGAIINDNEVDEIVIPHKELSLEPGTIAFFGPFPTNFYNQINSDVYIDVEDASVLFNAFSVF